MNQKDKIFGEKSNVYVKKMTNDELSNTLMSINCDGQTKQPCEKYEN